MSDSAMKIIMNLRPYLNCKNTTPHSILVYYLVFYYSIFSIKALNNTHAYHISTIPISYTTANLSNQQTVAKDD